MTQPLRAFALAATLAAGLFVGEPASARSPVSNLELELLRAGILTPFGYEVGMGATIRTFVDGQLALESRLTWTEQGLIREAVSGQPTLAAQAAARRAGLELSDDWIGLVLENPDGFTAALNSFSSDRIANLVVNTASNRDIRIETEITLNMPELERFQQQIQAEQTELRIQDVVMSAVRDAVAP